jgi:anti-sigma factor RsiW
VTRPSRRVSTGDRLAYVDDCLSRADRAGVEDRMLEDPELRKQIEGWLAQNEAIRTAFADPSAWSDATAGWGRARNRWADPAPPAAGFLAAGAAGEAAGLAGEARRHPAALRVERAPAAPLGRPVAHRLALLGALAVAVVAGVGISAMLSDGGSAAYARAATSAYRSFGEGRVTPVEIATADRAALERWFAAELGEAAPVPDLSGAGLALLGGRIVPGAFAPAAFVVYEDARQNRIALETEPSAAAAAMAVAEAGGVSSASWIRAGRGFALVARAPRARVEELARRVRDALPAD